MCLRTRKENLHVMMKQMRNFSRERNFFFKVKTREQKSTVTEMKDKLDGLNSRFGCQGNSINLETNQRNILQVEKQERKKIH